MQSLQLAVNLRVTRANPGETQAKSLDVSAGTRNQVKVDFTYSVAERCSATGMMGEALAWKRKPRMEHSSQARTAQRPCTNAEWRAFGLAAEGSHRAQDRVKTSPSSCWLAMALKDWRSGICEAMTLAGTANGRAFPVKLAVRSGPRELCVPCPLTLSEDRDVFAPCRSACTRCALGVARRCDQDWRSLRRFAKNLPASARSIVRCRASKSSLSAQCGIDPGDRLTPAVQLRVAM